MCSPLDPWVCVAQPTLPNFTPQSWGGSVAASILFAKEVQFPECPKGMAVSAALGILAAVVDKDVIVYGLGDGFKERLRCVGLGKAITASDTCWLCYEW